MAIKTDLEQMDEDTRHGSEKLHVEFKSWMDISKSNKDGQGKIARHIAALANQGGGRLYFGVDDDGVPLPASTEFTPEHYRSDAIHNLLKTRLEPPIQCEVRFVDRENGVRYPVVHVPSHGALPISAKNENSFAQVYVRSVGPESVAISTAHQWEELLKRCMRHRENQALLESEEDRLSRTQAMTKAITESVVDAVLRSLAERSDKKVSAPQVDWETITLLADATRSDFLSQISALPLGQGDADRQIARIAENNVTLGYALLDNDLGFVTLETPHKILRKSAEGMQDAAYFGWHDFIVLPNLDVAPRSHYWKIGDRDVTGVEGMRLAMDTVYFGAFDYWRAYGNSVFVTCQSYREDYMKLQKNTPDPFLTSVQVFIRLHSLLAHAVFTARQVPTAERIALFTDHRGLNGRYLAYGYDYGVRVQSPIRPSESRFPTKLIVTRAELLDDYFGTLKKLCVSFLELWAGGFSPEEWFTPEKIDQLIKGLQREGLSIRLLGEDYANSQAERL